LLSEASCALWINSCGDRSGEISLGFVTQEKTKKIKLAQKNDFSKRIAYPTTAVAFVKAPCLKEMAIAKGNIAGVVKFLS
jgi:fructose/tagatose bisphosphate aldolase